MNAADHHQGPALAGLGVGSIEVLWFAPAMIAGVVIHWIVNRSRDS